jgi:hypothetical protein
LNAVGTSTSPIVFTSWQDNSVGGATGNAAPAAGDWSGIYSSGESAATLQNVRIKYASTALSVTDDAAVSFHGSVVTSAFGVLASSDVYVDATNVDWGSASGPSPIGTGVGFSGPGVLVNPWIGFVFPAPPNSPPTYMPPSTYTCAKIAFIGARGSGDAPQGTTENYTSYPSADDGLGNKLPNMINSLNNTLAHYGYSTNDVKVLPVRYEALSATDVVNYIDQNYYDSIYDGVNQVVSMILDEESHCPSEKLILAGYSQGALAIHLALQNLADSSAGSLSSSHIAAILLLADPAKFGHAVEETWENDPTIYANYEAGAGVVNGDGIWTKTAPGSASGPLPPSVTGRTLAFCHNHDPVCSPGLGFHVSNHTSYDQTETGSMGVWAADKIAGLGYSSNQPT